MIVSLVKIGRITMVKSKIFNNIEKEFELFVQTFFFEMSDRLPSKRLKVLK